MVQNLIERCLQLYMSRNEVVATLLTHAKVNPQFTDLVWQRLEEENADFFKAYHRKLKLKDQTCFFNYLLHRQSHMMLKQPEGPNFPLASMQNVDSLPSPHSFIQQPPNPIPSAGFHFSSSSMGTMSHVEDINHTLGNFVSLVNSENDMVMNGNVADTVPIIPVDSLLYSVIKQPPTPSVADHLPINSMTIMSDNDIGNDMVMSGNVGDIVPLRPGSDMESESVSSFAKMASNIQFPSPPLDMSGLNMENKWVPDSAFNDLATSENWIINNFSKPFPSVNHLEVNYPNAHISNQQVVTDLQDLAGFEGFLSVSSSPEIGSDSPNQNGRDPGVRGTLEASSLGSDRVGQNLEEHLFDNSM